MSDLPEVRWRGGARQAASGHFRPRQPVPWPRFLPGPEPAARLSPTPRSVPAGAAQELSQGGRASLAVTASPHWGPGTSPRTQPRPEVKTPDGNPGPALEEGASVAPSVKWKKEESSSQW